MKIVGLILSTVLLHEQLVAASKSKSRGEEECEYSLEVLQVQDGSGSFHSLVGEMARFMTSLTESLRAEYDEFRFGLSSFVDKPIPLRGVGSYGAWNKQVDWCYRAHTPLTNDNLQMIKALEDLGYTLGSGNDFPENPFEALIFAAGDENVGWTPAEITHSASGKPIVRVLMLVTDDIPHEPPDAYNAIDNFWNYPRSYPNAGDDSSLWSTGGFGAHNFPNISYLMDVNIYDDDNKELYLELADLFALVDHDISLTIPQERRMDELIEFFGPYPYPSVVEHPGDTSIADCTKTEYPSVEQVGTYLREHDMNLIVLVAEPTAYAQEQTNACRAIGMEGGTKCLKQLYTNYAERMGISAVVAEIDGDNAETIIMESILAMTDAICLTRTLPPGGDITTTTLEPTSTELESSSLSSGRTLSETADSDGEVVVTSTEEELSPMSVSEVIASKSTLDEILATRTSEEAVVTSIAADISTIDEISVTRTSEEAVATSIITEISTLSGTEEARSSDDSETESTTENEAVIVPPVAGGDGDEDGVNIGLIIGSAAGGVAAVAAAGFLIAKFGVGAFGTSQGANVAATQQVETPDMPLERETVEEITMDMFQ